ncbi:MAG: hypothetical protein WBZ36_20535 [Candidatus Nitrosopolaris sp.]
MTIGLKFATLVMVVASLVVSGILAAADSIPTTAQGPSSNLRGGVTSSLQSAKMHLTEVTKNIKMGDSQAALMQINMTRQAITLAGLKFNTTIICNNTRNEAYCVAPTPFLE